MIMYTLFVLDRNTLPLFPDPFSPKVVVPVRVLSLGQIDQFHKNININVQ